MSQIQNCIEQALERKAQEILFGSQQPVRFRVGKDIVPMSNPQMSAQEMRQVLAQILNDDEKKLFYEKLKIKGMRTIGSISFKFDFQIDLSGVNGSVMIQNPSGQLWALPTIVTESVMKPHGLNLIVGPRRSGKTAALHHLLHSAQGRKKVVAIFSDDETHNLPTDGNVLFQFTAGQFKASAVPDSADVVMIDSQSPHFCELALRLAEEGRSVVMTLPYWNLNLGLQRMIDLCEGSEMSKARRLGSALQMGLGVRVLPGIESSLQGAFELLFADSEVQKAILQGHFELIPNLMKASAERTGMRSLNQTLFQLLMKRKIELKTAFEASPEPEELDSLLKKVGI
jgi:twitching motility protein PilT